MVLPDIKRRIITDYGTENQNKIIALINEFGDMFTQVYKEKPSPRIIRCVIRLAEADENKLVHYMEQALRDWRDVIYWAEYDKEDNKGFIGNRRFGTSS